MWKKSYGIPAYTLQGYRLRNNKYKINAFGIPTYTLWGYPTNQLIPNNTIMECEKSLTGFLPTLCRATAYVITNNKCTILDFPPFVSMHCFWSLMSCDSSRVKLESFKRDELNFQTPLQAPRQLTEEKFRFTTSWSEKVQGKFVGQSTQLSSDLETKNQSSGEAWLKFAFVQVNEFPRGCCLRQISISEQSDKNRRKVDLSGKESL